MTGEERQRLFGLTYFPLAKWAAEDREFYRLLVSDPDAAVSAFLGFPIRRADLDAEAGGHFDTVVFQARYRLAAR